MKEGAPVNVSGHTQPKFFLGEGGEPFVLEPNEEASPGRVPHVPDHQLFHRIGRGSYGEVWLARNVLGTYRAVKVVYRSRFSDAKPYEREYHGIQRFEPLSRSHDGLMDVLQAGRNEAEGYFYYVMELADDANAPLGSPPGGIDPATYLPMTLAERKKGSGRLPAMDCMKLGAVLAGALARLHQHGLIHRDIKPSNIIFSGGVPKLADIGLVTDLSESFSYVGTEGFIPPEGPNSPQADVYSLGKVLYELATGKDRLEFPDPGSCLEDSTGRDTLLELNAVLVKACDADLRRRYQSADEMWRDLLLIQEGKSVRKKRSAERRLRRVVIAGVAIALLTATVLSVEQVLVWRVGVLQERSQAIAPALRGKVKPRAPATPRHLLDLSSFYNASLVEPWYPSPPGNTLAALPQRVQAIDGVSFDVRGIVQLTGQELQRLGSGVYPQRMNDLTVGRWVKNVHILGGVLFEVMEGREVARLRVRYTSGEVQNIPWVYGRNVRALWQPRDSQPRPGETLPAWTGQNAATRERDLELRLYKFTWENPHPEKEILRLEFASAQSGSAPFLIAVTLDEHEPLTPPSMQGPDFREQLQAAAPGFPRFPSTDAPGPDGFRTLALNRDAVRIGDGYYDGFRFTVPRGAAVDMVWAFQHAAGMHFNSWYIMPMKGSLKTGFEDWHHGCAENPRAGEDSSPDLCLQFLDGRKLRPGAEYFIWFHFPNPEPVEIKAQLAFPAAGLASPNRPETLAATLGLTPLLRETPLQFHRHYCLVNW